MAKLPACFPCSQTHPRNVGLYLSCWAVSPKLTLWQKYLSIALASESEPVQKSVSSKTVGEVNLNKLVVTDLPQLRVSRIGVEESIGFSLERE